MGYNGTMSSLPEATKSDTMRQPGWVLLLGTLGTACLMIGLIMLAMLQAPVLRWNVIITSCLLALAGAVCLSIAWLKRRRAPYNALQAGQLRMNPQERIMESVHLSPQNSRKLDGLSRKTGKTRDQLVNEAIEGLEETEEDEATAFALWRQAMLKAAGIWKDRDDLPDFQEIRSSLDRNLWNR